MFILLIKLEVERSLFINDKPMKVWGLKNAKIAGKRHYFDETYDFIINA